MPTVKKYPKISVVLRSKGEKLGALTVDDCKELIGWTEEPEDTDWGKGFVLKDLFGRKVRLLKNPRNRPFRRPLADRYANEHIRGKWSLNLETIVIADNATVVQGQHRLVGIILAEQMRQLEPNKWGKTPLVYETLLGFGASTKPENANTYDLGPKRSLGDVIYRHQRFGKDVTPKKQKSISLILAGAIRLVWLRVGGKQVSFAPHFPHSEALEFYSQHPDILKAVDVVVQLDEGEEGNEKCISSLMSPNYAAGLFYLMAQATSWKKATDFWKGFASGEGLEKGDPILSLRQLLVRFDAGSGSKRDEIVGAVVKAWLLWTAEELGTSKDVRVSRKKSGDKFILSEFPRIGGIDSPVEVEVDLTQEQLVILSVLKSQRKEVDYTFLRENTGRQTGTLANAIMEETKQGKENPYSLVSRGLVQVAQYEPEDGQTGSPFMFQLTTKGKKLTV